MKLTVGHCYQCDEVRELYHSRRAVCHEARWSATELQLENLQEGAVVQEAVALEREACARLCEQAERYRGEFFAALIRARTNP